MTAITAFRAFFVARSNEKSNESRVSSEPSTFRKFRPKYWLNKTPWGKGSTEEESTGDFSKGAVNKTGISTFIEGSVYKDEDRLKGLGSRLGLRSESSRMDEERADDLWPLQDHVHGTKSIMVKKDISFLSERVRCHPASKII